MGMRISILTICPEEFESFWRAHVIRRAQELGLLELDVVDMKTYAGGSYRHIDDSPFGGGNGLILRCQPVLDAVAAVCGDGARVIALAPIGTPYRQEIAERLAEEKHLVLICGHYEGMDARIYNHVDEILSVGDYVLSGGELPAMVIADSVARLLPGNLKAGSAEEESFSRWCDVARNEPSITDKRNAREAADAEQGSSGERTDGNRRGRLLEYPQYTQPADFRGEKVPEVLLSGNHEAIRRWREEEALRVTRERRPDLL